jgi:ribulose 1,5-bisphosphate synthetase/thiazole synthase
MTTAYKVLGQAAPNATTETGLYTVGAGKTAIISSLTVANRAATVASFRVSISVGGGATATKDYLYYDVVIPPNDTFIATVGWCMSATDVMRVYASTANLSFNLCGSEIS